MTSRQIAQNRRSGPRRQPKASVRAFCREGQNGLGANLAVSILDFSETGLRILATSELQIGQDIEIEISFFSQSGAVKRKGRVMWCVEAADGHYCLGARFRDRLSYGEFNDIARGR
jgi:PilZ domain